MTHIEMDEKLCGIMEAVKDIYTDAGIRQNEYGERYCLSRYQTNKLDYIYDTVGELIADIRLSHANRWTVKK